MALLGWFIRLDRPSAICCEFEDISDLCPVRGTLRVLPNTKGATVGLMDTIKGWFSQAADAAGDVGEKVGDVAEKAGDMAGDTFDTVKEKAGDVVEAVKDRFDDDDESATPGS